MSDSNSIQAPTAAATGATQAPTSANPPTTNPPPNTAPYRPPPVNTYPFVILFIRTCTKFKQQTMGTFTEPSPFDVAKPGKNKVQHPCICVNDAGWPDFECEGDFMRYFFEEDVQIHLDCFTTYWSEYKEKYAHWLIDKDKYGSEDAFNLLDEYCQDM
ncbi:hypothetical protein BZA77DRAFT_357218 [Pyronema omphalodes]|nr:hypothetical protein BZA77DRAFT_357218 [Pyronema omphalodes]